MRTTSSALCALDTVKNKLSISEHKINNSPTYGARIEHWYCPGQRMLMGQALYTSKHYGVRNIDDND